MIRAAGIGLAVLAILTAGCESAGLAPPIEISEDAETHGALDPATTREDLDGISGKRILVEGVFNHIQGRHATVRMASGLLFTIPHFDHFRKGDDWFKYVGHTVVVGGILHVYTKDVPGYEGPSISIETFSIPE